MDIREAKKNLVARRFGEVLREDGVRGVARKVRKRVVDGAFSTEYYIWYELPLGAERPRREMPEGIVVRKAEPHEAGLLTQLDRDPEIARKYLAAGHDLWLALEGDKPAFGCWIHRETAPNDGGDWFDLPDGVVCLEDSVTSPDYRGRGVAPAAWCHIGDELAAEGLESLITKVATGNLPSRRAVLKAGFRDAGLMMFGALGSIHRVRVDVLARGTGEELQRLLQT